MLDKAPLYGVEQRIRNARVGGSNPSCGTSGLEGRMTCLSSTAVAALGRSAVASILKVRGRYRVQIRMRGVSACRTFSTLADAKRWAKEQEVAIDRGQLGEKVQYFELPNLGDLLDRYAVEVSPSKKGAVAEHKRIRLLKRALGTTRLDGLRPAIRLFKEHRLRNGASGTVLRDLALLRHVVAVARRDWSIPVQWPEVSMPSPPSKPRTRRPSRGSLMPSSGLPIPDCNHRSCCSWKRGCGGVSYWVPDGRM